MFRHDEYTGFVLPGIETPTRKTFSYEMITYWVKSSISENNKITTGGYMDNHDNYGIVKINDSTRWAVLRWAVIELKTGGKINTFRYLQDAKDFVQTLPVLDSNPTLNSPILWGDFGTLPVHWVSSFADAVRNWNRD